MIEDYELIKWNARPKSNIDEILNQFRPKLKEIYVDPILHKEVKVYEERWCI